MGFAYRTEGELEPWLWRTSASFPPLLPISSSLSDGGSFRSFPFGRRMSF